MIRLVLGALGFVPLVIFSTGSDPHFIVSADGAIACVLWSSVWFAAAGFQAKV